MRKRPTRENDCICLVENEYSELVLNVRLSGDFVIDVIQESLIEGVPEEEIVFRALLMYAVVVRHVDDSEQVLLRQVEHDGVTYIETVVSDRLTGQGVERFHMVKWPPYLGRG
jgi:hypothetical protein